MLALGSVGLGLQSTRPREPRVPLRALDGRSFAIVAAIADGLCPGGPDLPDAWTLQVPERVDAAVATWHPATRDELVLALRLWENALTSLVLHGRPRPFSTAEAAVRDRIIDGWRTSRFPLRRTAYKAVASLIAASYWSHPATFAHLGYPGPPRFAGQGAP